MAQSSVFVIGAGVAGLACARVLSERGFEVQLGDKGRGPGGRLSTRRAEPGPFDHGANFFTASDPAFRKQVESWKAKNVVAEWRPVTGRDGESSDLGDPWYVGAPSMNAVVRHEAEALGAEFALELGSPLPGRSGAHVLSTKAGHQVAEAEMVVLACPAPQATALLPPGELADGAVSARYAPCWTLMADFPGYDLRFEAETFSSGILDAAFSQGSKPGRSGGTRLTVHATADFSEAHLEDDPDEVSRAMLDALRARSPGLGKPSLTMVHRWRYARVTETAPGDYGLDLEGGLATCGDWHLGPKVEAAWLSGHRLGQRLAEELS